MRRMESVYNEFCRMRTNDDKIFKSEEKDLNECAKTKAKRAHVK